MQAKVILFLIYRVSFCSILWNNYRWNIITKLSLILTGEGDQALSDILKVTTPLINKSQAVAPKPGTEQIHPYNIQDPSRVVQTHNQSELQKQYTGMLEGGDAPVLLLNLLKDPAVAVSYLKNIFLLEEIFKLLPVNNKTMTQEIEQIFQDLILGSEDILGELKRQEQSSTAFKGALFDFLRELSKQNDSSRNIQLGIATLLKSANNLMCKEDILDAVANSLQFLRDSLAASHTLSEKLDALIARYRASDASEHFISCKEETQALMKEIEESILFSPKISKVLSIIVYNLSRYNNSMDFFHESSFRLRQLLTGEERGKFIPLLDQFLTDLQNGVYSGAAHRGGAAGMDTRVMDALVRLLLKQSGAESLAPADSQKMDHILHSLLSSPCSFTPLLHYIIPVNHIKTRAFAEIWINPDSDEKDMPNGVSHGKHFLLVIDVENIGRFEAELFAHEQTVDFTLFCPPGYESKFEEMMRTLPRALADSPYRLGETRLATLERSRSLMDVFKSLPYKRVGVDVKI